MGGRYVITGAQIGTIEGLAKDNSEIKNLLAEVQEQHIGESTLPIDKDMAAIRLQLADIFDTNQKVEVKEGEEVTVDLQPGQSAEIEADGDIDVELGEEEEEKNK